jgi:hypothetical protein
VDVPPCPVAEIFGLSEAAGELLPFLKTRAERNLVHAILFRKFRIDGLFDDSNFALGHTIVSYLFPLFAETPGWYRAPPVLLP